MHGMEGGHDPCVRLWQSDIVQIEQMVASPRMDAKRLRVYLDNGGLHHTFSTGGTLSCIPSTYASSSSVIRVLLVLILPFEPVLIDARMLDALNGEDRCPFRGPSSNLRSCAWIHLLQAPVDEDAFERQLDVRIG